MPSILINDTQVVMEANENGDYRGLHIVLVDASTGQVSKAKVFDTHESSQALDLFLDSKYVTGGDR